MLNKILEYYVSKLVSKPEMVNITQVEAAGKTIIEIRVASNDLAKVIGKEGRTFKALRSFANAVEPTIKKDIVVDISG